MSSDRENRNNGEEFETASEEFAEFLRKEYGVDAVYTPLIGMDIVNEDVVREEALRVDKQRDKENKEEQLRVNKLISNA